MTSTHFSFSATITLETQPRPHKRLDGTVYNWHIAQLNLNESQNLQSEMFIEERVDCVLDDAGLMNLMRFINGHRAVWITTPCCNHWFKHTPGTEAIIITM